MRRRKMKKQKRIIIVSSLCLLLCLCVGYAAFNTQLSIRAKGNILDNSVDITDDVVTEGDGLYEDIYEEGRYVYRGQDPDNYIMFNDELWRIIAKEADGTYKIIRNELLPQNEGYTTMAYDASNHRTTQNNSYCDYPSMGCGVFAAVSGTFRTPSGSKQGTVPSGSKQGTVTENSSIQEYLNGEYYTSSINSTAKRQMISHPFNIGAVEYLDQSGAEADSIEKNIAGEKMYTWTGNVGLANVSDILKASLNSSCKSATDQCDKLMNYQTTTCNLNYLLDFSDPTSYWAINSFGSESGFVYGPADSSGVWFVASGNGMAGFSYNGAGYGVTDGARPVVFLKSDIKIVSGTGAESDPYIMRVYNLVE